MKLPLVVKPVKVKLFPLWVRVASVALFSPRNARTGLVPVTVRLHVFKTPLPVGVIVCVDAFAKFFHVSEITTRFGPASKIA